MGRLPTHTPAPSPTARPVGPRPYPPSSPSPPPRRRASGRSPTDRVPTLRWAWGRTSGGGHANCISVHPTGGTSSRKEISRLHKRLAHPLKHFLLTHIYTHIPSFAARERGRARGHAALSLSPVPRRGRAPGESIRSSSCRRCRSQAREAPNISAGPDGPATLHYYLPNCAFISLSRSNICSTHRSLMMRLRCKGTRAQIRHAVSGRRAWETVGSRQGRAAAPEPELSRRAPHRGEVAPSARRWCRGWRRGAGGATHVQRQRASSALRRCSAARAGRPSCA